MKTPSYRRLFRDPGDISGSVGISARMQDHVDYLVNYCEFIDSLQVLVMANRMVEVYARGGGFHYSETFDRIDELVKHNFKSLGIAAKSADRAIMKMSDERLA